MAGKKILVFLFFAVAAVAGGGCFVLDTKRPTLKRRMRLYPISLETKKRAVPDLMLAEGGREGDAFDRSGSKAKQPTDDVKAKATVAKACGEEDLEGGLPVSSDEKLSFYPEHVIGQEGHELKRERERESRGFGCVGKVKPTWWRCRTFSNIGGGNL